MTPSIPPAAIHTLEPRSIHVWLTALTPFRSGEAASAEASPAIDTLSSAELMHANLFARPEARHRYLQVRSEVRRCLSAYTHLEPRELIFARGEQGKPTLSNAPVPLSFNLSHSGDFLALAVDAGTELGIDLEQSTARRSWQAIAERYFHPEELSQLLALPEAERHPGFYRWWTLKEAFFKARGSGISAGLDKVIFDLRTPLVNFRFAETLQENSSHWQFQLWQWLDSYHLALACHRTPDTSPISVRFYSGGGVDAAKMLTPTALASSVTNHSA